MRPVGVDWLSSAYPALRPKATQTKGFCGRLSGVSAGRRGGRRIMTIDARHACGPTSVVLEFHMNCCRDRRGMSGPVDANGLPSELGAFDMLLHRGEANPRTRSGIMALEILDTTPDWNRFVAGSRTRRARC